MGKMFFIYILIISIVTTIITAYDKAAAKKRNFRISESTLILCAIFGGAVAELITMLVIRHKTRHIKFMLGLPVIIMIQLVLIILYTIVFGVDYA